MKTDGRAAFSAIPQNVLEAIGFFCCVCAVYLINSLLRRVDFSSHAPLREDVARCEAHAKRPAQCAQTPTLTQAKTMLVTAALHAETKTKHKAGHYAHRGPAPVVQRFETLARIAKATPVVLSRWPEGWVQMEPADGRLVIFYDLLKRLSPETCVFFIDATDVRPLRPLAPLCRPGVLNVASDVCEVGPVKRWWQYAIKRSGLRPSKALRRLMDPRNGSSVPNGGIVGGRVDVLLPLYQRMVARLRAHLARTNATYGYPVDAVVLGEEVLKLRSAGGVHLGYPVGSVNAPMWANNCCKQKGMTCYANCTLACKRAAAADWPRDYYFVHKVRRKGGRADDF